MANAATLSVSIFARTSSFRKGLRAAVRDLQSFGRRAALAATAAGSALGYLAVRQADVIANSARVASRLGLTVDTLTALHEVGDEAGISAETLDKALQIMGKNTAAFSGNNLDKLLAIADHFDGITDSSRRLSEAQKIFGKGGFQILDMLDNLRPKLQAAREETQRYGTAVSDLDAAKVVAAKNAWGDVKDILDGVGTQIAVQASGVVKALADQFTKTATEGGTIGDKVGIAMDRAAAAIGALGDSLNKAISLWYTFKAAIEATGAAAAGIAGVFTFGQSDFINQLVGDYMKAVGESKGQALQAAADASEQTFSRSLQKFVEESKQTITQVATEMKKEGLTEISARTDRRRMPKGSQKASAEFLNVDLQRVFVGGLQGSKKEQQVRAPQLDTTNQLLRGILFKGGAAVAG